MRPWEAIVIGMISGILVLLSIPVIDSLRIDDPTNTFAVHGVGGIWGMLAIGLFAETDSMRNYTRGLNGLFKGGGLSLLGPQALASGILIAWSMLSSTILLYVSMQFKESYLSKHHFFLVKMHYFQKPVLDPHHIVNTKCNATNQTA